MLFLSKPALKYAIGMCIAEPRYAVIIAPANQETLLRVNQDIQTNIRSKDYEARLNHASGLEVYFANGSYIKVIRPSADTRGITAHLVIADENLNGETINHVQCLERQFWLRYNQLHRDDDWIPF